MQQHHKYLSLSIGMLLIAILTGCGPNVHLYPGPERDPSQLTRVAVIPGSVTVESLRVDGRTVPGTAAVYLLPGEHNLQCTFTANSDDFEWKFEVTNSVDVFLRRRGQCSINFHTSAGQSLYAKMRPGKKTFVWDEAAPTISLVEEGLFKPEIATGVCQALGHGGP